MKIIFLCGSLDSGKSGIGDYSRILAGRLRDFGMEVLCISMHEHSSNTISDYAPGVTEVMIPATVPWKLRIELLQLIVSKTNPDWISLQYSPYSYGFKGLPWRLSRHLGAVKGAFRWHIMFHELWIGEEPGYSRIQKLLGGFQRLLVKKLTLRTAALCHTTNEVYKSRLGSLKIESSILPLFSNIPIVAGNLRREDVLGELETEQKIFPDACWIFVVFGGIHPEWSPEPLLSNIFLAMQKVGRKAAVFVTLGKSGPNLNILTIALQEYSSKGFYHLPKGEMNARGISEYLQCADYGIAISPLHLLGKSGSVAALREHGVPIIVTRLDEGKGDVSSVNDFVLLDENFEHNFLSAAKYPRRSVLDETATLFISDLKGCLE